MKSRLGVLAAVALVMSLGGVSLFAADRAAASPGVARDTVEFFSAMNSGDIEVKYIARDSRQGNVLITNKSGRPLAIKMPAAFAGVPALAQFGGGGFGGGGGGFGGGGGGFGGGGGGSQGIGGGGGGGFDDGGFDAGFDGGFFNIAAEEKVRKIPVTTVCLEHGKKEPNPRIEYKVVPLESVTDKPEIIELCKMVGRREVPQNAAQAAAWRLANDISWAELAQKDRVRLSIGYREKYFSPQEIQLAQRIAAEAAKRGKMQSEDSLGSRTSANVR